MAYLFQGLLPKVEELPLLFQPKADHFQQALLMQYYEKHNLEETVFLN